MVNVEVSLYFLYYSCHNSYYMSIHISDHTSLHTFQPRSCQLHQFVVVNLCFLYASCRNSYHISVHISDHIEDLSAKIMSAPSIQHPLGNRTMTIVPPASQQQQQPAPAWPHHPIEDPRMDTGELGPPSPAIPVKVKLWNSLAKYILTPRRLPVSYAAAASHLACPWHCLHSQKLDSLVKQLD